LVLGPLKVTSQEGPPLFCAEPKIGDPVMNVVLGFTEAPELAVLATLFLL
jgi:hypothetical protein